MQLHATWGPAEIGALRERTGLTIERLAHRVGVSSTTIVRWLNGSSRPSPLAAERLEEIAREVAA